MCIERGKIDQFNKLQILHKASCEKSQPLSASSTIQMSQTLGILKELDFFHEILTIISNKRE